MSGTDERLHGRFQTGDALRLRRSQGKFVAWRQSCPLENLVSGPKVVEMVMALTVVILVVMMIMMMTKWIHQTKTKQQTTTTISKQQQ